MGPVKHGVLWLANRKSHFFVAIFRILVKKAEIMKFYILTN